MNSSPAPKKTFPLMPPAATAKKTAPRRRSRRRMIAKAPSYGKISAAGGAADGGDGYVLTPVVPILLPYLVALRALRRGTGYGLLLDRASARKIFPCGDTGGGRAKNRWLARAINFGSRWLCKYASEIVVGDRLTSVRLQREIADLDVPVRLRAAKSAARGRNANLKGARKTEKATVR